MPNKRLELTSARPGGMEPRSQLNRGVRRTSLPERGAWVVALPMKIGGGSGAPLRAVAFLPRAQ